MGSNQKTPHIVVYMYVAVFSPKLKYPIYSPHGVFPTIPLESPVTLLWGMDISGLSHVNDYQMFKINQSELYRKTRVKLDEKSALDWQ